MHPFEPYCRRPAAARGLLAALLLVLTLGATPAFPQEAPANRAEALAGLAAAKTETRARAVVWIANHGSFADAELLHARLRDDSPFVRDFAERGLWLLWTRSGDAAIDQRMAEGVEAMNAGEHARAIAIFSEVIRQEPAFAEGWNKRATAYYLAQQFERSMADCEEVFRRNAKHFGALSGMGLNLVALDRYDEALRYMRRALEVNPNMAGVEMQVLQIEERLKAKRAKTI